MSFLSKYRFESMQTEIIVPINDKLIVTAVEGLSPFSFGFFVVIVVRTFVADGAVGSLADGTVVELPDGTPSRHLLPIPHYIRTS